ncbi:response regulator [Stigmatella hybrida]|uniref:response regulator n=1 Tax=Stigmatella hybrida TaxID=394097 RepID=UPI001CDA5A0D|nr:response regulator [Stigmatella hybrida]
MFTQKKILLVDDSPTVLLMERLLLQDEPYALLSASNGREAVEAAFAQQPDLILMDVVMPGMDGFEVCRILRSDRSTCTTPIILVTTKASLEHVERGYESGCNDYVTKPFNGNELRAKIENFLGR